MIWLKRLACPKRGFVRIVGMGQATFDGKILLFVQFLRQAQDLTLEIPYVYLRLKFFSALNLNKLEHFSKISFFTSSNYKNFISGIESFEERYTKDINKDDFFGFPTDTILRAGLLSLVEQTEPEQGCV